MKRLDLDFHRNQTTHKKTAGLLLLLAGVAAGIVLADSYSELKGEQQRAKATLAQQHERQPESNIADAKEIEPQLKQAAATIEQLSFPWDKLFKALESSMTEDVALLSVQPDVTGGTVTLNAEARDWDSMLDYIRRLGEGKFFTGVHLVSHQIQQSDPQRPVRFTLSCRWLATRSQHSP